MRRRLLGILLITIILFTSIPYNAYASTALRVGSKGSEVAVMQQRLIDLGYLSGRADGIFGTGTKGAVISFQKANNLTADGIAGTKTLSVLHSTNAIPAGGGAKPTPPSNSPVTTPIQRVLRKGDRGNDVAALQSKLNELKYNAGTADGIFGLGTEKAVIAFQKAKGLAADGIVGSKTIEKLFSGTSTPPATDSPTKPDSGTNPITSVLKKGSSGSQVAALQQRLNKLGFNCGIADGIFGQGTYNAVVAYQKTNGLSADGIVGPATAKKLFTTQAGSGSSPTPTPTPSPTPTPTPSPTPTPTHTLPPTLPPTDSLKGNVVIIDPGHGGNSTVSHDGYYEEDLALDIALRFRGMLEQAGASVLMTRSDDRYLSLFYRSAFANKVVLDLEVKDVTNKRYAVAAAIAEKQAAMPQTYQDNNDLTTYGIALNQIKQQADAYQFQYGITAQSAVQSLSALQSGIEPLKNGLALLGINAEGLSLAELMNKVSEYSENELEQKTALIANMVAITNIMGSEHTIASLELKAAELNNTLSSLLSALDYAESLRNGLSNQSKLMIYMGNLPLTEGLIELDSIISSVEQAKLLVTLQVGIIEKDIQALSNDILVYNNTLADLERKQDGFQKYLSNPSLNTRTGIYEVAMNESLNIASKDLTEVMNLTRAKYQDTLIFISIHLNATEAVVTSASGVYTFYRDNAPETSNNISYYKNYNTVARNKLSLMLLQEMNKITTFEKKKTVPYRDDFSVLRENNLVSALVEVGFMNNPNDLKLVSQSSFRENVAFGMLKAVIEYFK